MLLIVLLLAAMPLETWGFRTARMEGAAGDMKRAAAAVQATANGIASSGRLRDVAVLRSQADALHQKVVSASLAAGNLDQIEGGVEGLRQVSTGGAVAPSAPETPVLQRP